MEKQYVEKVTDETGQVVALILTYSNGRKERYEVTNAEVVAEGRSQPWALV